MRTLKGRLRDVGINKMRQRASCKYLMEKDHGAIAIFPEIT